MTVTYELRIYFVNLTNVFVILFEQILFLIFRKQSTFAEFLCKLEHENS